MRRISSTTVPTLAPMLVSVLALAAAACSDDKETPSDTTATTPTDATTVNDGTTATDATTTPEDTGATTSPDVPDTTTGRTNTCTAPAGAAIDNATVPDGFCASVWADDLAAPRGLFVTDDGDVLVVERSRSQVTVLWDDDHDGVSGEGERAKLAGESGLNHGVTVHDGFLYGSSPTTVFRWPYAAGTRADLGDSEVVVKGIPDGGHSTRTLVFDAGGRLYVSCGSGSNVDSDSRRSRIRRFSIANLPDGGLDFGTGEVFADGLRNEVGLAFDAQGRLWGVQNGMDDIFREELGGDIHDDNPAEMLSRFDTPGAFHGYPFCWAEFKLPQGVGHGPGTMWAHESTIDDGTHTDAWCQSLDHVDPPELAMQAHSAPLDLEFYDGGSFPSSFDGDLFITFHGSWDRDPPTGYKVVHVDVDASGHPSNPEPFFEFSGAGDIAQQWPHRPVGVRVGKDGQLFVSSDASDMIVVIGHQGQ